MSLAVPKYIVFRAFAQWPARFAEYHSCTYIDWFPFLSCEDLFRYYSYQRKNLIWIVVYISSAIMLPIRQIHASHSRRWKKRKLFQCEKWYISQLPAWGSPSELRPDPSRGPNAASWKAAGLCVHLNLSNLNTWLKKNYYQNTLFSCHCSQTSLAIACRESVILCKTITNTDVAIYSIFLQIVP